MSNKQFEHFDDIALATKKYNYSDIRVCRHWNDMYGNPFYHIIMRDGTDIKLDKDYAFVQNYVPVRVEHYRRKKDL